MSAKLTEVLSEATFQDELHSLLWLEAFENRGEWDAGWSCRDHAAVVGAFLSLLGLPVTIMHGKCSYVQGPTRDGDPPVAISQAQHTWIGLEGSGFVDLSPKLEVNHGRWRAVAGRGVIGETWFAERRTGFLMASSPDEYAETVSLAAATSDSWQAAYLGEEFEDYAEHHAADGLGWANSPLTDRLREGSMPADAYARFGKHLLGLLRRERKPLAELPSDRAWQSIASDGTLDDAVDQIRDRIRDRAPSAD